MIEIEFDYSPKSDWLIPRPKDKKYIALELIGNRGWSSDMVIEDLEAVQQCREGTFKDEIGQEASDWDRKFSGRDLGDELGGGGGKRCLGWEKETLFRTQPRRTGRFSDSDAGLSDQYRSVEI